MGRPPCCEKMGVKKGPWTPEEDIILVSYIQEHGPGNWRAVPTNTGLMRCSKSCRLRWTNYLRPGIKRGNFTEQEEKLIIHLQALLGNRWAAISSYLPERTDNDIKNFWNTHLKKKLRKLENGDYVSTGSNGASSSYQAISKGQWERKLQTDINMAKRALSEALSLENPKQPATTSTTTTYASSTENISRLLQGWMKSSPKLNGESGANSASTQHSFNYTVGADSAASSVSPGSLESLLGRVESSTPEASETSSGDVAQVPPLFFLETWLFDESAGQGGDNSLLIDMQLDDTEAFC